MKHKSIKTNSVQCVVCQVVQGAEVILRALPPVPPALQRTSERHGQVAILSLGSLLRCLWGLNQLQMNQWMI